MYFQHILEGGSEVTIKLRCPECLGVFGISAKLMGSLRRGLTESIPCPLSGCGVEVPLPPDVEQQLRGPDVAPRLLEDE